MIDMLILQKVADISAKIGPGYTFNMKNYLDGYQLQWKNQFVSILWRNINWEEDKIEIYKFNCQETKYFFLSDIKSANVSKIYMGNF
tara:strand:- start:298 stop:558 length:261 start_codon:yes stop_codon:yes gene_type:complete